VNNESRKNTIDSPKAALKFERLWQFFGVFSVTLRPSHLAQLAAINLHFALAEVTSAEDREAIARVLDHVRQAEHALSILMAECEQDVEEAA
jgi:hypothetical protein